jgi:hypothetical protein
VTVRKKSVAVRAFNHQPSAWSHHQSKLFSLRWNCTWRLAGWRLCLWQVMVLWQVARLRLVARAFNWIIMVATMAASRLVYSGWTWLAHFPFSPFCPAKINCFALKCEVQFAQLPIQFKRERLHAMLSVECSNKCADIVRKPDAPISSLLATKSERVHPGRSDSPSTQC